MTKPKMPMRHFHSAASPSSATHMQKMNKQQAFCRFTAQRPKPKFKASIPSAEFCHETLSHCTHRFRLVLTHSTPAAHHRQRLGHSQPADTCCMICADLHRHSNGNAAAVTAPTPPPSRPWSRTNAAPQQPTTPLPPPVADNKPTPRPLQPPQP